MKYYYSILVILALAILSCKSKDYSHEAVGSYHVGGFGGTKTLVLDQSGQFTFESALISCLGSDYLDIVKGDYEIKDRYIFFTPKIYRAQYFEYDKPSNKKLIWDSLRSVTSLRDFYDSMVILPWNKKIFLLGMNPPTIKNPSEFLSGGITHFLNHVIRGDTGNFQSHYFQKISESSSEQNLKLALPKEWGAYLLETELKTQIIKIDSIQEKLKNENVLTHALITVNGGKNQGVHVGYELYSNGSPRAITIVEVSDNFSKGVSFLGKPKECQIGLSLSTRLFPKEEKQKSQ